MEPELLNEDRKIPIVFISASVTVIVIILTSLPTYLQMRKNEEQDNQHTLAAPPPKSLESLVCNISMVIIVTVQTGLLHIFQ